MMIDPVHGDVESTPSWRDDVVVPVERRRPDAQHLNRRTLSEMLRDELRRQIESGELVDGDVLPTESELCQTFGVGRTTVREALQGLAAHGFVQRRGGRLMVIDPKEDPAVELDLALLSSQVSVGEVFAGRKLLEVEIARLVAVHRSDDKMQTLYARLAQSEAMDPSASRTVPERFHVVLAGLCENAALTQVYRSNVHLFISLPDYWRLFSHDATGGAPLMHSQAHHAELLAAIDAGDSEAAQREMGEHLDAMERSVTEQLTIAGAANGAHPGALSTK